jgi:hypothetical protein
MKTRKMELEIVTDVAWRDMNMGRHEDSHDWKLSNGKGLIIQGLSHGFVSLEECIYKAIKYAHRNKITITHVFIGPAEDWMTKSAEDLIKDIKGEPDAS